MLIALLLLLLTIGSLAVFGITLSQASPAINCILKYSADENTSPPVLTTVGELRNIPGPQIKATIQKVTNHSSAVPWEEILPTLKATGTMKCEVNLNENDVSHQALITQMATQPSPRRRWYLYLPDGTLIFASKGYVAGLDIGPLNVDGVLLMSFELAFTSIPALLGNTVAW